MPPFTYQKAATAADAVSAIAAGGAGTRFLAGGTTLYDLMKLNVEVPSHIVDINSLSELKAFDTSGSNELVFGALARMSDVAADPRLIRDYHRAFESLWRAASQQLAQHGEPLRKSTPAHALRLLSGGEPFACNKRKPGKPAAPPRKASIAGHALRAGANPALPFIG